MTMITNSSSVPRVWVGLPRQRYHLLSVGGSSRVDLQACKLGTGRRFTTSWLGKPWRYPT